MSYEAEEFEEELPPASVFVHALIDDEELGELLSIIHLICLDVNETPVRVLVYNRANDFIMSDILMNGLNAIYIEPEYARPPEN